MIHADMLINVDVFKDESLYLQEVHNSYKKR